MSSAHPAGTRLALLLSAAALAAGCAPGNAQRPRSAPPPTPNASSTASPSPGEASPAAPPTVAPPPGTRVPVARGSVFVIVMENKAYAVALTGPFTRSLASRYGLATNYHAVTHPSLPNYLAMTSGSTWGITDDGWHPLPPGGLGQQLGAAGVTWRAYFEGLPANCLVNRYPYAVKHNPFAYYGSSCAGMASTDALPGDLSGATPRLAWITPGLCNDTHDCSVATGDRYLEQLVPQILGSRAWQAGGLLFITWDEDDGSGANRVATIVAAPGLTGVASGRAYDHYSLLATIEDRLGVPRLGAARGAQPMTDLVSP